MAATRQQRAKLYTTLAETMGDEAADTLMAELPLGGWEQMATKDGLAGVETRLTDAMTAGFAELNVKLTEGLSELNTKLSDDLSELNTKLPDDLSELNTRLSDDLAQAATERATIIKDQAEMLQGQARQLYVIVTTTVAAIVAATVSIWIALFATVGA